MIRMFVSQVVISKVKVNITSYIFTMSKVIHFHLVMADKNQRLNRSVGR